MSAFIEKITDNLLKNPIISFLSILFLVGITGSLRYYFEYYTTFNINITDFASPADWISLGLGKFLLSNTIFLISTGPLFGIIFAMWADENFARGGRTAVGCFIMICFIIPIIVCPYFLKKYAINDGAFRKTGESKAWFMSLENNLILDVDTNNKETLRSLTFIGSTKEYMFFYEPDKDKLYILLRKNIDRMKTTKVPNSKDVKKHNDSIQRTC